MLKTLLLWISAIIITAGVAVYQRMTDDSYPLSGEAGIKTTKINYVLPRTCSTSEDLHVEIKTGDLPFEGKIVWKRYKSNDRYSVVFMKKENGILKARLPKQPPAGKLEYSVILFDKNNFEFGIMDEPVIARFKGDVPAVILVPHIAAMFFAMLLSTRTGLEIFNGNRNLKKLTLLTVFLLFTGGIIFGPVSQLYAFGFLWTGFPFGTDLADNKTLIAFTGWLIAAAALFKSKYPYRYTVFAAVLLLIIYLIPNSMFGSELDYTKSGTKNSEVIIINK